MQIIPKNLWLRASFSCYSEFISGADKWAGENESKKPASRKGSTLARCWNEFGITNNEDNFDKLFYLKMDSKCKLL